MDGEGWGDVGFILHPVLEDFILAKVGEVNPPFLLALQHLPSLIFISATCSQTPPLQSSCSQYWKERTRSLSSLVLLPGKKPSCRNPISTAVPNVLICQGLLPTRNLHLRFLPPTSPVNTEGLSELQCSAHLMYLRDMREMTVRRNEA